MTKAFKSLLLSTILAVSLGGLAHAQERKTLIVAEPVHGTGYLPL